MAPSQAGKFLCYASKAYKQYEDSHIAKQELRQHIDVVKQLANSEPTAAEMRKALKELEEKVEVALEKQGVVVKHVREEKPDDRQLLDRVEALEKQLDVYLKHHEERKKRITQIEKRMKRKEKR